MTDTFYGKSALIYGAANGIGRAAAHEFARRGARIAVADIDIEAAQRTAGAIAAEGGEAIGLACDVMSDASVSDAAAQATQALGDIDIVMNNVGGIVNGNPEDIPIAEWERLISLNFLSIVRSNAIFIPLFIARGRGHIVNTASFAGLYPFATTRMPYVAAKAAAIALSESMALYLLPLGVRVSCLLPGPVLTGIADTMKSWTPDLPMRGPGSSLKLKLPEEAAVTLADGMQDGRILIATHEDAWQMVRDHAAAPDQFISDAIERFANGDTGLPGVDPEVLAIIASQRHGADD